MLELITRTAKLIPYNKRPRHLQSFVTAYRYEPLPDDLGAKLGNLYVIIEALCPGRAGEELADLIIESVGERYYNHPSPESSHLSRFEEAIKTVNHELAAFVSKGNASWIGKLSAVIAVQTGSELHIAQTGSAEAFLYRGKTSAAVTSGHKDNKPASPGNTFAYIASGELEAGDRILIATPALIHQLPLAKINDIITGNSPNSAIAEITELIKTGPNERIAALVIEVITPEHAALQIRPEEPNELAIGVPAKPVETVKTAAAPIAVAAVKSGDRITQATIKGWQTSKPRVRKFISSPIFKKVLTSKWTWLIIIVAIILMAGSAALYLNRSASDKHKQALLSRYNGYYSEYLSARSLAANGSKQNAVDALTKLISDIDATVKSPDSKEIDALVKSAALAEGEPRSLRSLSELVIAQLDEIESLHKVIAKEVLAFSSSNQLSATNIEAHNGIIYAFADDNSLYVVDKSTKKVTSTIDTSTLGVVIDTALSADGSGLYILTSKPSVWHYRFNNGQIKEQAINHDAWPSAKRMASYMSNLYLLDSTELFKTVRSATGYSPKTSSLSSTTAGGLKNSRCFAVDGNIYVFSETGLYKYFAGELRETAQVPSSMLSSSKMLLENTNKKLILFNDQNDRIGVWKNEDKMIFEAQYSITNVSNISSIAIDQSSTGQIYVAAGNKLYSLTR